MGCPTLWKKSRNWHCHYVFFIFCMGNRWFWCQQCHLAQGCELWSNLYKMLWSSIQCWTMVVFKKLQGFDYEIGSQIYFPNFMFRQKFLYWSVAWRYGNEKNISTRYKDSKESTIQAEHFLDFQRLSWNYWGPKSNLHPQTEISLMGLITRKLSIHFKA